MRFDKVSSLLDGSRVVKSSICLPLRLFRPNVYHDVTLRLFFDIFCSLLAVLDFTFLN